jgi:GntR family transcriptional regulator/MocR family aminotransferase
MSLYIVSQLLINQGDVVLVGQLSNYSSNTIFQESGAIIKTIPIDSDGLDIDYIRKHFFKGSIRCVYVSAHRHYPTTATLSAARRLQLLQLAKDYGFAIIEDDYDYDFQFEGSAMLPMATANANGMVIYLGKLGQSLFPSFQTGFVVAPEELISEANNYLALLDAQGDLIQEQMLSELIDEGEIYRLVKKNVVTYKKRRDCLCDCFNYYFKNIITYVKPNGGLAIWLEFCTTISLVKFAEEAERLGVFLPKTILYQDKNTCAIRFGFGHLNEEEIEAVVIKLKHAYNRVIGKL